VLSFLTAEEASIDAFLSVSEASPYQERLRDYAHTLLAQGTTRLGWCVVGLESDVPVARAALWAMPGDAVPSDVVLIAADWDDEDLVGGHALLRHVHEVAARLGAESLRHHVDDPPGAPQYQENESARIRLLTESGYELLRDGLRWLSTTTPARKPLPATSLAFRGLPELGDEAFVEAIAATYEGTRDSWLTRSIQEHGLLDAARSDFLDYQQMEYRPEWWELAYTEDGALAGVIMAARNPGSAVIAYVGVVRRQRGRGLAAELVRRGTEQLVASGAEEIRGDCDRENVAMVKAFRRAGFEQIARRRTFERALAT
jgi:ribosomal protein S18 acetylase RimI-like enzyme